MAVRYKLLKMTGGLPKNADFKVVPMEYGTVGLKQMQGHIERATSLTLADLVGVLEALKTEMLDQLALGNRVYLDGIGYFSLSVGGEVYEDPRSHRFRLRNPAVRTVNFRPEKSFLKAMSGADFENATYQSALHSVPTPEEVEAALATLFAEQSFITTGDLRGQLHLSRSGTYRLAAELERSGKLQNVGTTYRKIYVRGEG